MNVLLFGATGMVGQGALRECLLADDISRILTIGRTATGQSQPQAAPAGARRPVRLPRCRNAVDRFRCVLLLHRRYLLRPGRAAVHTAHLRAHTCGSFDACAMLAVARHGALKAVLEAMDISVLGRAYAARWSSLALYLHAADDGAAAGFVQFVADRIDHDGSAAKVRLHAADLQFHVPSVPRRGSRRAGRSCPPAAAHALSARAMSARPVHWKCRLRVLA